MNQFDLFAEPDEGIASKPLRRRTDPETSKQAAAELVPALGAIHAFVLDYCNDIPRTAQEIAHCCWVVNKSRTIETYRKRVRELGVRNRITAVGKRKCSITGKTATIWRRNNGEESSNP